MFEMESAGSMDYTCTDASGMTTQGSTSWTLEAAALTGLAPADQAAFHERFRDKRLVSTRDPQGAFYYLDFLSRTTFREFNFGDLYDGTYTYRRTGANTADLDLAYEDGDHCDVALTFTSETSGNATFVCVSEGTTSEGWRAIDRP